LIMAYLANLWVSRARPANILVCFVLLGLALVAGLFVPRLGTGFPGHQYVTTALLVAPLFFAGLIFSKLLSNSTGLGDALAANLFRHQHQTLPCVANNPKSFGFLRPTGHVCSAEFFRYHAYSPISSSDSP